MPITAATAQRVALETLGFDEFPAHVPGLTLANMAGEWLCSTRSWSFLDGAEVTLGTVAGQNYIALPADFQGVIEIERADSGSLSSWFSWTTVADIVRRRGLLDPGGVHFAGAIGWRQDPDGAPVPVLELHPTPTATTADVFRLRYRRTWRALTADHEKVPIPGWMDALYLEAVRAFARGAVEEDQGTTSQRCAEVLGGALYATAVRRDAGAQTNYGRITGGAAQMRHQGFRRTSNVDILNP